MKNLLLLFFITLLSCKKSETKPVICIPDCSDVSERVVNLSCKYPDLSALDTTNILKININFDVRYCNHPVMDTTYSVKQFNKTFKLKTDSIRLSGLSGSNVEYTLTVNGYFVESGLIQNKVNRVIKI